VMGPNTVTADERSLVQLDASAIDPDGDALTWAWQQVGGPAVALTGQDSPRVQFLVPEVASDLVLAFSVVASDAAGAGGRAEARVEVRNVNRAPEAVIAGPVEVASGAAVTLNGAGSVDPDRDAVTWAWTQVSGPAVALSDPALPVQVFPAPVVTEQTTLVWELAVTDGEGATSRAQHTVRVLAPPVPEPEPQPAPRPRSGCGCGAVGADAPLSWGVWLAAAAWAGRRRGTEWP